MTLITSLVMATPIRKSQISSLGERNADVRHHQQCSKNAAAVMEFDLRFATLNYFRMNCAHRFLSDERASNELPPSKTSISVLLNVFRQRGHQQEDQPRISSLE